MTDRTDSSADFGFQDVPAAEKAGMVRRVFDSVAPRYDLMNDLMSLGTHRFWKATLIDVLAPRPGIVMADVAGGTGDISFRVLDRVGREGRVFAVDINESMLSVGRDRGLDRGIVGEMEWVVGDAERLPLADRSLDAVTIAFGLRNVTDRAAALAEMRRVLKPGGRFLCLEFSRVAVDALSGPYDTWSFRVLPVLGRFVAGDPDSYRYLAESIRRFPPQPDLAAMMVDAGFGRVGWRNLSGGIVAIHSGWRI